jgi:multiple antibiotic resistance protein
VAFLLAFLTLFAAIDVVGVLPVYHSLTASLAPADRRRVLNQSCLTALAVAAGFALGGKHLFRLLGIEVYDFKVAGGLLLLIFSVQDLLAHDRSRAADATMGVVPIGVPLIVGPAVLTTLMILVDEHGYVPTFASLGLNLIVVWLTLASAAALLRMIGAGGAKALGKIASLFLAAIGVMMIRKGVSEMLVATLGR